MKNCSGRFQLFNNSLVKIMLMGIDIFGSQLTHFLICRERY
jgi:hypothetical protein